MGPTAVDAAGLAAEDSTSWQFFTEAMLALPLKSTRHEDSGSYLYSQNYDEEIANSAMKKYIYWMLVTSLSTAKSITLSPYLSIHLPLSIYQSNYNNNYYYYKYFVPTYKYFVLLQLRSNQ